MKRILDPSCGSRMFWFDKTNPDVLFGDIRDETHILCDGRGLNIKPDVCLDFRSLQPVIGHKSGKNSNTHWITFIK